MSKSANHQHQYEGYDFADFAQEFLRRNPDYQAGYEQLRGAACLNPGSMACRQMAHAWGLEIPFRAELERIGKSRDLARMRSTLDRHPRNGGRYAPSGSTCSDNCKS